MTRATRRRLILGGSPVAELERWIHRRLPEEACGVLLGEDHGHTTVVRKALELPNSADGDRTRRFAIDPLSLLDAIDHCGDSQTTLVGIWHSHPRGLPTLSAEDRTGLPAGLSLLVAAPRPDGSLGFRSFRRSSAPTPL